MTQTTQIRSWAMLNEPEKNYHIQKPEPEDNLGIYLSLLDNLNVLYKNLFKINYLVQKRNNSLNVAIPHLQEIQKLTRHIKNKEEGEKK
ncbi:MAG: hypothetical protein LBC76_11495 [Treponema sp.]|jgi:hypothetical protein|nr:hypothetical protein [Treponema sp.]